MHNTHLKGALTFKVPLSYQAHSIAQECREGLSNTQKSQQVYLNSLAIYAVNYYLDCLGFATDWQNSDSRNPLLIKLLNTADLIIPNLGKIECLPVLPDADFFPMNAEISDERICYIAVQFQSSLKEATILGFTRKIEDKIPLNKLSDLEELLEYLDSLEQTKVSLAEPVSEPILIKLGDWLEGIIDTGWQTVEQLLNPQQLQFRSALRDKTRVTRGQRIDLDGALQQEPLALIFEITSDNQDTFDIVAEVQPIEKHYLREGVKIGITDKAGNHLQATSRTTDNWIQLGFKAEKDEEFAVTVSIDNHEITQQFIV